MRQSVFFFGVFLLTLGITLIFFSFVKVPFQEQESYAIPYSSPLLNESFLLPYGKKISLTIFLKEGDTVSINYTDNSSIPKIGKDINFSITNNQNSLFLGVDSQNSYTGNFTVPFNATWNFNWEFNSNFNPFPSGTIIPVNYYSTIQEKTVTVIISKIWNEIAYRDTTTFRTIIPSTSTTVTKYIGIAAALVGLALAGSGYFSKNQEAQR